MLVLATVIRSAFGFGEALVAVPLLSLFIPVEVAAPVAALVSVTVAAIILAQDTASVHFRSASLLVGYTLPGIPLGMILLTLAPEPVVKLLLAVVIISFAIYLLVVRVPPRLHDDRHAWMFGFAAGVLGGAYGMNGPPVVVYGALRGWSANRFRATLQGYFLPASGVVILGYAILGLWTAQVTRIYLLSLAPVLLAVSIGRWLNRRLDGPLFMKLVYIALVGVGLLLLAQAAGFLAA